jgi:ankyrin repeat protein
MFLPDDTCLALLIEYGLGPHDTNNWMQRDDPAGSAPVGTMHYQLLWAIRRGMTARARLLIDHGVDVDAPDGAQGRTPYKLAVLGGRTEIADDLLAHGATATELDDVDRFVGACMAGDRAAAQAMLAGNPDLAAEAQAAHPEMVHEAARDGNLAAATLMADLGIDIDTLTATTPLHQAAWQGHLDMVRLLVEHGADPRRRDREHAAPPIGWAAYNGQQSIVDYLDGQDMDVFAAAARGNLPGLERMLDDDPGLVHATFAGVRPAGGDSGMDWITPLAFAAVNGRDAAVSLLLGRGARADLSDGRGGTLADAVRRAGHDALADRLGHAAPL